MESMQTDDSASPYDAKPWLSSYDSWVGSEIEVPGISFKEMLLEGLQIAPRRPAMIFFDRKITFDALDTLSAKFAAFLAASGCRPGTVVGINLPNLPQYLIAFVGAIRAGCSVTGVSFLLTPKELSYQLNDSEARVLVTLDTVFDEKVAPIADEVPNLKQIVVAGAGEFLPPVKRVLGKLLKKIPTGKVYPLPEKQVIPFGQVLKSFPARAPEVKCNPEDICLVQYTGGTTGRPKGALLTHRNIVANVTQSRQWANFKAGDPEVGCSAFPYFHLAGMMLGMMALCSGASQCLIPDPRDTKLICRLLQKYRPTIMANVPTLYQMLMDESRFKSLDFSRLRLCLSGAAPFAGESIHRLESMVGKGKVMEVYGMTETSPLLTMNPYGGEKKIGSVGIPIQGTRVKLVDVDTGKTEVPAGSEGELIANGPQVMAGYKGKPEETAHAIREFQGERWLYTGDVAKMDKDGYFTIVDRTKDMINVGGYKVFSREVEETLYQYPGVAFCAVVGVPNNQRPGSELVKAVIQPTWDILKADIEARRMEMIEYCRKQMAPYKVPKFVEFTDAIPLTAVGKVDKKALRG